MTRRRLAAAVGLGAMLYGGAIYLVATAELGEPRALIAMITVAGLIFTVVGTIAALQRPDNRTGAQMLAVGLLWSVGALQLAERPFWFTLGYVLSGVAFVAFAHLILSYPTGRLHPGDEWLVWIVLALVTLGPLAVSLVDPTPIPGCDDCPQSAFLVTDRPGLAQAVGVAFGLLAASVAAAVFVRLVRRFRAASPPLRRVIGPVYFFTLIALVGLVTANLVWTFDAGAGFAIELAALGAAGPDADRLPRRHPSHAAPAGRDRRPGDRPRQRAPAARRARRRARRPVAPARVLVVAAPGLGRRRGAHAEATPSPAAHTRRPSSSRAAGRVAALLHDRSLADQRELVDAVAATASLAFEKERLQAELRAQYRFLETIIDTAPSLLSVVDTEGRIRNFNRAVEVASGLRRPGADRGRVLLGRSSSTPPSGRR